MVRPRGATLSAEPAGTNPFATIPLGLWASRVRQGRLVLAGMLDRPLLVRHSGAQLALNAGPVTMTVTFRGGSAVVVDEVRVEAPALFFGNDSVGQIDGSVLSCARSISVNGRDTGIASAGLPRVIAEQLVEHFGVSNVSAHGVTGAEVRWMIAQGMVARISEGTSVDVFAVIRLRAGQIELHDELVVSIDEPGLSMSHTRARWLSDVARVRVRTATLRPDGEVLLEGGAMRGLDPAVRTALRKVSTHLTHLVREHPKLAPLRRFLKH